MLKVYGIPNCNTVKKALDWLKQNNLHYEFHDYKKKGITAEKLQEWAAHFGWENILNTKGTTWAKLSEKEKKQINTATKAIEYLMENTSAIRRPIIEAEGKYLIRFDEEQYKTTFR
jgi:Spx/MgsR family transcriptional regulator